MAGCVVLLVAAGAVAYARTRDSCGDAVTSLPASKSSSPFLDAEQRAAQPDHDRDVLVSTLAGDPAPIGEVLGAVGYHYEQWAQVSAYAQGIGVRTRDNPDFTMLDDETLRPAVERRGGHEAVDVRRQRRSATWSRPCPPTPRPTSCRSMRTPDGGSGARRSRAPRCAASDPFATQLLDDEDTAVLTPGSGSKERIVRLSARDGGLVWERELDADSGDFLGDMGDETRCWPAGARSSSSSTRARWRSERRGSPWR